MTRTFEARRATRERVPLLVALISASGAGKTYSALRLATGIVSVCGGETYFIDTEARRALHYARDKSGKGFDFQHVELVPPFNPLSYLDAIRYCVGRGAGCVVVDSMSHEHEGEGGVLDMQEGELDRMAGDDWEKRKRCAAASWIVPKAERRRMTAGIVGLAANFVFCFRAAAKLDWKNKTPKGEPTDQGWQPIAGAPLVYEMTARALLQPGAEGVPDWNPTIAAERNLIKRPEQFRALFERMKGLPISEEMGAEMARWAAGDSGALPLFDRLRQSMLVAATVAELEAFTPELKDIADRKLVPAPDFRVLRALFAERKKQLELGHDPTTGEVM